MRTDAVGGGLRLELGEFCVVHEGKGSCSSSPAFETSCAIRRCLCVLLSHVDLIFKINVWILSGSDRLVDSGEYANVFRGSVARASISTIFLMSVE